MAVGICHSTYIFSRYPDIAVLTEVKADQTSVFIRGAQLVKHAVDLVAGARLPALGRFIVADESPGTVIGFVARTTDHAGVTRHAGSGLTVPACLTSVSLGAWTANPAI